MILTQIEDTNKWRDILLSLNVRVNIIKMPLATTWMDLGIVIIIEVRERKTNTIWHYFYVECQIWHKWTYLRNRNRVIDLKNTLTAAKYVGAGRGMSWKFGIIRCKLLYKEWINDKLPLYSTESYIQYPLINHSGNQ